MGVTLLDGGVATQLANHVDITDVEKDDPLWCARFLVTNKEAIKNSHRDYVRGMTVHILKRNFHNCLRLP